MYFGAADTRGEGWWLWSILALFPSRFHPEDGGHMYPRNVRNTARIWKARRILKIEWGIRKEETASYVEAPRHLERRL
jgi:hypothetical protein